MSEFLPQSFDVSVTGGEGEITRTVGGLVMAVGVIPPDAAAKYDVTGYDAEGFLLYFGDDVVGNVNMAARAQIFGTHRVVISQASHNGIYKVKLWFENW